METSRSSERTPVQSTFWPEGLPASPSPSPEDEAASIGALTSEKHKHFRQRRLTASNRTLQSSLQRLLNRTVDDNQPMLH